MYCTFYKLKNEIHDPEHPEETADKIIGFIKRKIESEGKFCPFIRSAMNVKYENLWNLLCGGPTVWTGCDDDMVELSEEFPNTLFSVCGEGDSGEDVWKTYYYGGKIYEIHADQVFNDPESKLRNWIEETKAERNSNETKSEKKEREHTNEDNPIIIDIFGFQEWSGCISHKFNDEGFQVEKAEFILCENLTVPNDTADAYLRLYLNPVGLSGMTRHEHIDVIARVLRRYPLCIKEFYTVEKTYTIAN